MRDELLAELRTLGDRAYQERTWPPHSPDYSHYDNFAENVNLLYDDLKVLPDPSSGVGVLLFPEDVAPLEELERVLGPLLDDLADAPVETYLSDRRWDQVVAAAAAALEVLAQRESGTSA